MFTKKVVITGMGALTPIGNSIQEYWHALAKGESGAVPITRFDVTNYKTKFACELKNYHPEDHFSRKEARQMDYFTQYALVACKEAVKDAALDFDQINGERAGVIWGSGIGGLNTTEETVLELAKNNMVPQISPFFIPKILPDTPSGYISIKYGLKGPSFTTVSACASSLHAIISAFQIITLNSADMMVVGGSEGPITRLGIGGFNALRALSTRNDSPTTASRPFDKTRDGFVVGEGAGVLILESYEHAKARGANIYVELVGIGMSSDAHHITAPATHGVALALQNALNSASLQPQAINYINAHGTSTPLGDINEIKSIQQVFGMHIYDLNISATKSMTGHLLGAAGTVESIAAILAIKHQLVPPTINFTTQDEVFDEQINFTFNKAQPCNINYVQNNSFGFGGHNASVIFKRWEN